MEEGKGGRRVDTATVLQRPGPLEMFIYKNWANDGEGGSSEVHRGCVPASNLCVA